MARTPPTTSAATARWPATTSPRACNRPARRPNGQHPLTPAPCLGTLNQQTAMTTTRPRPSLLTLEAYAKIRKSSKPKPSPTAGCAACAGRARDLQFEDERTVRRQIQEMLRIEKIFDEEGIRRDRRLRAAGARRHELEGDDADRVPRPERAQARAGAADRRRGPHVRRGRGHPRVYAIADEDLDRENEEKTSAVHFGALRVQRRPAPGGAIRRGGEAAAGLRPPELPRRTCRSVPETLARSGGDLR